MAPPMTEKEMITMIVDTLPMFCNGKMVGYTPSNFVDLVFTNERIEVGLKRGKMRKLRQMKKMREKPLL